MGRLPSLVLVFLAGGCSWICSASPIRATAFVKIWCIISFANSGVTSTNDGGFSGEASIDYFGTGSSYVFDGPSETITSNIVEYFSGNLFASASQPGDWAWATSTGRSSALQLTNPGNNPATVFLDVFADSSAVVSVDPNFVGTARFAWSVKIQNAANDIIEPGYSKQVVSGDPAWNETSSLYANGIPIVIAARSTASVWIDPTVSATTSPEPATWIIVLTGAVVAVLFRKRLRRRTDLHSTRL